MQAHCTIHIQQYVSDPLYDHSVSHICRVGPMPSKNTGLTAHVHWTVKAAKVLHLWQPGQNYFLQANTGKLQILLKIYHEDKEGKGRKTPTRKKPPKPSQKHSTFPRESQRNGNPSFMNDLWRQNQTLQAQP